MCKMAKNTKQSAASVMSGITGGVSRKSGVTIRGLSRETLFATYAYYLRTKCGITETENLKGKFPWQVIDAPAPGLVGWIGDLGKNSPTKGNIKFYARGTIVPSPSVEVEEDESKFSPEDLAWGEHMHEQYLNSLRGESVEEMAEEELPVSVEQDA